MYVVLVGDGTWNDKGVNTGYYGTNPVFMPVHLGWVDPWQGEVDSAHLLVTLVGDDVMPDMLIGRIPVNTSDELTAVIDKIISFEQSPDADWMRQNMFIADNTPDQAGDFVVFSEELISSYIEPGFSAQRVYEDDFSDYGLCGTPPYSGGPSCPNVNSAITETLGTVGAQFVTYTGHGAPRNWAHEQIMVVHLDDPANPNDRYYNDVAMMQNGDKLPVILSMTCLDGYWFHPTLQPALAETFLRTTGRGAVATFSPTGLGVGTGHDTLASGFLKAVYQEGIWELGAATLRAKLALIDSGISPDLVKTFTIFGDPALKFHSPYDISQSPEDDSQSGLAGTGVSYTLLLTNTGSLTDTYEIQATGNVWTTTFSASSITLLPGETSLITVTVQIPPDVPGGMTDVAQVEAVSQGDRSKTEHSVLQTTANVYGVIIDPPNASQIALPGSNVTYGLMISNTSNDVDVFDIQVGSTAWQTIPSQVVVGPLSPSEGSPLTVTVSIPIDANDYNSDTAVITATSQADPNRQAISSLTTTARTYGISLDPSIQYGSGMGGEQVVYSINAINTGGFIDEYDISLISSSGWDVSPAILEISPLPPEAEQTISFTLSIPVDAPGGYVDTVNIIATSKSDPNKVAEAKTYTTVNSYGLLLTTPVDMQFGKAGETIVYHLSLTNLSNVNDVFSLTMTGNNWQTDISPLEIQLLAGQAGEVLVQVYIPADASNDAVDAVTITATSHGDPAKSASLLLTTEVKSNTLTYLPVTFK
jgi:uncharacterized membrane protein